MYSPTLLGDDSEKALLFFVASVRLLVSG